jgi:3-oxoacyl-(acyl-carrier-protein) synthase
MAKIVSTTGTNHVILNDKEEAEALAAMLKKHGIRVIVSV